MPALRLETIAKHLKLTRPRVSQLKRAGMPVGSLQEAEAWYQANVRPRVTADGGRQPASVTYDIAEARAKREHHEANLAAMREAEKAGQLVDKGGVIRAAQSASALMRQAMDRLPARLGDVLAAETDAAKIRGILADALDESLAEFRDACRKVPDAGG